MREAIPRELLSLVPEIDFDAGYRYFVGNIDNYLSALMSTLKSIKSKLSILQYMRQSDEYEGLRIITQKLRVMFSNIGAHALGEASYQIEAVLLNGNILKIRETLTEYLESLENLTEHLELFFQKVDVKSMTRKKEGSATFLNYDFTKTKESIKLSSDYISRKII